LGATQGALYGGPKANPMGADVGALDGGIGRWIPMAPRRIRWGRRMELARDGARRSDPAMAVQEGRSRWPQGGSGGGAAHETTPTSTSRSGGGPTA
jgi:hypothetical protein